MARFSTEFPVDSEMNQDKFCKFIKDWLTESRNSKFTKSLFENRDFFEKNKTDEWRIGYETLSYTSINKENFSGITIQYIKDETNITFTTELTFTENQEGKWVSCQITNSTKKANISLPPIKKPRIINKIISSNFGGNLGISVTQNPHYLEDLEENINLAAELISGDLDCRLPIIYISIGKNKKYLLSEHDTTRLAIELSGIAHVIVEPSRNFSLRLSELTNNINVFNGYIGIYWANGNGRNIIFTNQDTNYLYEKITEAITSAVSNRRPLEFCNINYVKNQFDIYQFNQTSAANELLDLSMQETNNFKSDNTRLKQENNFLKERLENSEKEITRLKDDLRSSNKNFPSTEAANSIVLNCTERDLYPNEIKDIILSILKESKNMHENLDRRKHIIESILENNSMQEKGLELRGKIKNILKGYTSMNNKIRTQLEDIGFKIEEGKHYKISFKDDPRYSYVITKSGSDSKRGGQNAATDICKKLGLK